MNNLIETLPEIPADLDSNKIHKALYLNDVSKYRLRDIENLNLQKYRNIYSTIKLLELSNNSIYSLKLKGYKSLERIVALNNKIQIVEMNITNLRELNLEGNQITKMFELNSLPLLESLNLNRNLLKKISFEDFKFNKNTLIDLKVADNEISFSNVKEFFTIFELFGKNMKILKNFEINGNPFSKSKVFRNYEYFIILQCSALKTLDGKMIELYDSEQADLSSIQKQMIEEERRTGINTIETAMNKLLENKMKVDPTLKNINKEMGKYTQLGKLNLNSFDDFNEIIKCYLFSNIKSEEDSNGSAENELEEFETFLLYANLIIDATPDLEMNMFGIIAKFSITKYGKFASRALTYLKQKMTPSKISEVEKVLSSVVIDYLVKCEEDYLFPQVIKSLEDFVSETKMIGSFQYLITRLVGIFIKFKNNKLTSNNSSEQNKKKDVYLSITCFLSKASKVSDYLTIMLSDEMFVNSIVIQVKNLLSENDELLSKDSKMMQILNESLIIVCSMCLVEINENKSEVIKNLYKLVGSGLKEKIEQAINTRFQEFAKKNTTDDSDLTSKEVSYNRMLIVANLVRCYGSFLFRSKDVVKIARAKNSVPQKIINILVLTEVNDPIIISAACDFTLFFLENNIIKTDEDGIFDEVTNWFYNLRYLLPYLFLDKNEFRNACLIADKYGQKTTIRGKLLDIQYLNSEIINNLVISILRLIEYFGKNSKKNGKIKSKCSQIMSNLNDQNRDTALIECLNLPDENVKQTVAECFSSLDCSELTVQESMSLYMQIVSMNLYGDRTKKILSIIYLILNICFMNYFSKGEYHVIEKSKESIYSAYEMIAKNEEKIVTNEIGNTLKIQLSIMITVFLINCSCFSEIKNILTEKHNGQLIPVILYYENINRNEGISFPREVEKTKPGCKLENLLPCFKDPNFGLTPYNYVSLRILIHIADLLMGIPYPMFDIDPFGEFNEVLQNIKNQILERECERIKIEELNFNKLYEVKKNVSKDKNKKFSSLTNDELKEEQKNFINFFPVIFDFVLGRSSQKILTQYSKIWDDKFDKQIHTIRFSTNDKNMEVKSLKQEYSGTDINNEENIYEIFKKNLRQEDYINVSVGNETVVEYDYIMKDIQKYVKYGTDITKVLRKEEEESPNNNYIRSLFIAAFIRCIYAIMEYPADKSIREDMIKLLYQGDNIKLLSFLVDCTKLADNNISSKYLKIIRYVLLNSKLVVERINPNSYLNILGVITYMIRKIVRIFKKDLKITIDDHKVLLFEVSSCCASISNELTGIEFDSEELRSKTFESMINKDVINVLIKIVHDYMNSEANYYKNQGMKEDKSGNSQEKSNEYHGDDVLNAMVSSISLIIGEYISKCRKQAYKIIEILTKSFIFESVKMRKTFLREMLEYSRLSDLKSEISKKLKLKVNYITRVYFTEYKSKNSKVFLMVVTPVSLEFLNVADASDKRSDWEMKDFQLKDEIRIQFDNIQEIIHFELNNRMLIKTSTSHFAFFFYETNSADMVISLIKFNNSNVNFYENIHCFDRKEISSELILSDKEIKSDGKAENSGMIEENGTSNSTPSNNAENSTANITDDKCEVIICSSEIKSFFDFFNKISKGDAHLLPNLKVVVISKNKLLIYAEYLNEWNKINIDKIFSNSYRLELDKYISELSKCYKLIKEYDLNEIQSFTVYELDKLKLIFKSGNLLDIKIYDDVSYVKFKRAIFPFLKQNKLIVKDDYIDDIN